MCFISRFCSRFFGESDIWFTIRISLEKEIGCIVHHVLNISELQEQSGARLNLVREIYEPCGPDDRIVEISGAFQAKMNGIETLLNAMSNKPPPEGEQWTPAARNAAWKMDTWMMVPEGSVKFLRT